VYTVGQPFHGGKAVTAWVLTLAGVAAGGLNSATGAARQPVAVAQAVCFPLRYADAARVARKLTAALGRGNDAVVYADERTSRVFVVAGAATVRRATEVVRRLDVKTDCCLHVVPLKNADAAWAARGLRAILPLLGDDQEVHITADKGANAVIISAGEERAAALKKLLRWLDGRGR
jgi:type II secretory pathway component GspD/PulD (secretin)